MPKINRSIRLAVAAGTLAAAATPMVVLGAGAAPQASDLCQSISTSGTVLGSRTILNRCIPYGNASLCQTETTGLSPSALVTVKVCVPAPLAGKTSVATDF